jgi:predicted glutamine amidotransferase
MCELLAISSKIPTRVGFSIERLARHGGAEGPHRDGWGVAFYEENDIFRLREPKAASESSLAKFIEHNGPASNLVLSYIRMATQGNQTLKNTQPFIRELSGRAHVFTHNGELENIKSNHHSPRFNPIGDTDSEQAFCELMNRLTPLWQNQATQPPSLQARLEVISDFAQDMRKSGIANFMYADADALFVHAHYRHLPDDRKKLPGLYLLRRCCPAEDDGLVSSGISLPQQQKLVLISSSPLTDEDWKPLDEGEVIVISKGQLLTTSSAKPPLTEKNPD